jgi:uncharacterized membrane protein (UPF0127 family)
VLRFGITVAAFVMLTAMTSCDHGRPAATASSAQSAAGPHVILSDGYRVGVEIAASDATRQQGLMYRDRLPEDRGMIFLFTASGEYAFWMKNTLIPLDMIWIDEQNRVVHVTHDVPPCKADPCPSYPPNARARYVLELAAGVAARHHIVNGQTVRFEAFDNVAVE